jgi:hypothetical protein
LLQTRKEAECRFRESIKANEWTDTKKREKEDQKTGAVETEAIIIYGQGSLPCVFLLVN